MSGAGEEPLAFGEVNTPLGTMLIASSAAGVVALSLPGQEAFWRRQHAPANAHGSPSARATTCTLQTAEELAAYFAGGLRVFTVPLAPRGTAFQRRVWQAVFAVPYGETRAYGAVAAAIGRPAAARAVGHANGSNPLPVIVPCHRLIGSDGSLTGYGGGLAMKRWLIEFERRNAAEATGDITV